MLPDRLWRWLYMAGFPPRQWLWRRLGLARGGAFVAIRTRDDILVIRHSYRPGLDFPGGGLDAGETPQAAVVRELAEELSLHVDTSDVRYLGVVRRGFRGIQDRNHLFELQVEVMPQPRIDNREVIWAGPLSAATAQRRDLQIPVRWYLRRHGLGVSAPTC